MPAKAFFDSNILLYLSDETKGDVAEQLMSQGGVISVQVLNEFVNVSRRKHRFDWPLIHRSLMRFRVVFDVVPLSLQTHDRAIVIAERYGFSIYDSTIIAAALIAGCDTLWSEDLQNGQAIDDALTIRNPFVQSATAQA